MGTFDERVGTDAVRAINWSSAFNDEDLTSREDIQLTAPSTVGADYYYYACVAPVANEVNVDPMSNCSATTYQEAVRVLVGDEPDLVAEGPSVSDDILGPGQSFNLRVGVFNRGNGDSTATTLRYYLSEDSTLTRSGPNADEALGTDPVPALDAGGWPAPQPEIDTLESSRSRQVIELTAPTTTGFYYYFACADILESERATTRADNNCTSIRIQVAGGPDLTVESPRASATDLLLGEAFTFSATVVNLGDSPAAATTLRYYRSTDATISTDDMQVGTDPVGQLARGDGVPRDPAAESPQNIDLNAPDSIGTYYYYACVENVAGELVTGNNCTTSIEVRVRGAPDLRVESPSVSSDTLGLGQAFTFSATVFNAGEVGSAATTLRYYRSADAVISDEDTQVGEDEVRALAPGNTSPRPPAAESRQDIYLNSPRAIGTYYYGACVVAVRTETVVDNNCSVAVQVDVIAQPDLVVRELAVNDITLNTGQSFNLSADVVNVGGDHAAASVLRYYRSDDPIIALDGDVEVGTDPVREIRYSVTFVPEGEDLTSQEDIQLTAPGVEGIYHYYACVDAVPGEADTGNNCSGLVRVLVGNNPDLSAEGPYVRTGPGVGGVPNYSGPSEDTIVGSGQTFTFGVGVVNRGDGDSPATTLRAYFSPNESNPGCEVGRTWVGDRVEVLPLRASFPPSEYPDDVHEDSKDRRETELTAPTEAGRYCYGACVAEVQGEEDGSDNCTSHRGELGVRIEVVEGADLVVSEIEVDEDSLTLSATVTNYGRAGSPRTTLRYYRSTDPIITVTDDEVGMSEVKQLAHPNPTLSNEDAKFEDVIDLTVPTAPGTYYYGACVDAVPKELQSDNNCSRAVRVGVSPPLPDLVVRGIAASDITLNTGQSFNLSAAVFNQGSGNSAETTLRYYRSTNAIIDRDADQEIGTDSVREILYSQAFTDGDKTSQEDVQLAAPGVEGVYHYYACVDAVPGEADTRNNCSEVVPVLVGDDPDLAVEGPSASANVVGPGQTFDFRVGVVNRGDGDSPATVLRYYRSTDRTITTADTPVGEEGAVPGLRASFPPSAWPQPVQADSLSRQEVKLTAPTTAGIHYYGACVAAVPREADPSDDCSVGVPVEVRGAPDLVVEAPSVDEDELLGGQTFTLTATVVNSGDGGSAATTLRCYRSEDAEISSTDMQVGTDGVEQLDPIHAASRNPSARTTAECDLTAPTAPGTYYYGACVVAPPMESRTDNNCSRAVRVGVSPPLPDLVVRGIAASDITLNTGQSFNLSAAVFNQGSGNSAETTLRYYRSTNAIIDRDADQEIGTDSVREILYSQAFTDGDKTSQEDVQLAAPGVEGVYHYYACVDAVPGEADTRNNCSEVVPVLVGDDPDLAVEGPSASANVVGPGQTFDFRVGVVNRGDGDSPATVLRYYRSTDRTITTADTPVGEEGAVPGLRASFPPSAWPQPVQADSLSRQEVKLTAPTTAGIHYYGACVAAVPREADPSDDCSVGVPVEVRGAPDLVVEAPSVDEDELLGGQTFTLTATVVNSGDGGSAATTLRCYRSEDAEISSTDMQVGTDGVEQLDPIHAASRNPSARTTAECDLTAPTAPGTYYYGACVVAPPMESRTDNNCSRAVRVGVSPPLPDLVVRGIAASDITLNTGQSFNLSAAVFNQGSGNSAETTLRYYRSTNAIIDRDADQEIGTDPVREILYSQAFTDGDKTSQEDVQLAAPGVEGVYHYYACVDAVPGEADTRNNCSEVVPVLVGDDPDLAVEGPSASANVVGPGQTFDFRVGVVNRGDGDSPATVLRYYRSTDRTITTADTPVGEEGAVPGLRASFPPSAWPQPVQADSLSRQEVKLTAPTTAGIHYYGACVAAVPREADPSDDCSVGVPVEVRGAPDLVVEAPSVDEDELLGGQTFTLTATVVNSGDGGSAATTLRCYRSEDAEISSTDMQVGTDGVEQLDPIHAASRNPSARTTAECDLTAPTAPGTYYYGACVVAPPMESRTDNNCSRAVRVGVSPPLPDLVVRGIAASDITLNTGQSFNLSAAVFNQGSGNSAETTLRYYRSTNAIIDRDADQEIGTDPVREILYSQAFTDGDKTSQEDVQLAAPGVEGVYHYYACVDAVPGEADTRNNCSEVVPVLVGDDPDLAVEGPSASANVVGPGQTFDFRVGVVNRGDGDSPATVLRYYRSTDRTITTADTPVGEEGAVPGLRASFPPSAWPQPVQADSLSRQEVKLTAPTTAGIHYYGACVAAVPREADPSDDCSVGVPVEVRGAPDLVVEAPSVDDDKLLRGQTFKLMVTVANSGDGGSAATTLRCYRSEDAEISSTDMQVGTDGVEQLDPIHAASRNPSARTAAECDLTAPNLLGTYYYGACVVAPPMESRTDNNCSQSVPVIVSSGPDLVVEALGVEGVPASGKLFMEQSFRLTASVANEGDADFAETTLRFHRSTDAQVTSDDVEVGAVNVTPTTASGLEITLVASPVGVQYYGACVAAVPNEIDVTNNCASTSIRIRVVLGPDLVVEASRVDDDSLAPGQTFVFQASVVNDGDSESAQTTLRYYRSADDRISTRDTPIGTDGIPSLNVVGRGIRWNASRSRQGVQLWAPAAEGAYYYGACVDSVGNESNADNNCSEAVRVTVSRNNRAGDPDLAVDASVSKNDVAPGDAFTLRAQVWNYGDEASETTRLRYYRSTDAVISGAGDDLVLGAAVVEGIPKSDGDEASQSLHSLQVAAPNAPGTYYYGACVDPVAGDPDAKNNCSKGLRVVVGDNPGGEEGTGEGAEKTLGSWRGWRSVLLRPPPVGDGDAS